MKYGKINIIKTYKKKQKGRESGDYHSLNRC